MSDSAQPRTLPKHLRAGFSRAIPRDSPRYATWPRSRTIDVSELPDYDYEIGNRRKRMDGRGHDIVVIGCNGPSFAAWVSERDFYSSFLEPLLPFEEFAETFLPSCGCTEEPLSLCIDGGPIIGKTYRPPPSAAAMLSQKRREQVSSLCDFIASMRRARYEIQRDQFDYFLEQRGHAEGSILTFALMGLSNLSGGANNGLSCRERDKEIDLAFDDFVAQGGRAKNFTASQGFHAILAHWPDAPKSARGIREARRRAKKMRHDRG